MSIDQEIREFLNSERRIFVERNMNTSLGYNEKTRKKRKKKMENIETKHKCLKEKWKQGKKEIKIACHNINRLKTRGWKVENLLEWAEKEELTIIEIMETNILEKEKKFLLHSYNTQYK